MGAPALATKAQKVAVQKFHCVCQMASGNELALTVKATTEAEASRKVHAGYEVDYVIEILTPSQLEGRKKHLRRGVI